MPLRVQVVSTGFDGAPSYNSFYGIHETDDSDVTAWIDSLETFWEAIDSLLGNDVVYNFDGVIERFDVSTGQTITTYTRPAWAGSGTGSSDLGPSGTCLVFQWRTGSYINGRELRGRSYISGIPDLSGADGLVSSGTISTANAAASAYAAGDLPGIYSPTHADAATFNVGTVWNRFGLMRSRRD